MTFWQHRGGTPFRAQKTVDLEAPSSLRARKGQKLAPSKRIRLRRGPETLKRLKNGGKSGKLKKWKMRKKLDQMENMKNMVTKRRYQLSAVLFFGSFCTIFRAWPVGAGPGSNFGRKKAETKTANYNLYVIVWTILRCSVGLDLPSCSGPGSAPGARLDLNKH